MFCFPHLSLQRTSATLAILLLGFTFCQQSSAAVAQPGETGGASTAAALSPTPEAKHASIAPAIAAVEPAQPQANGAKRLWIASLFAVGGATTADAATSWGYRESNGILQSTNGTFGARGVAIKLAVVSALLVPEILLRKHQELRTRFAVGNFVVAGIFTGTSIYNVHAAATQAGK